MIIKQNVFQKLHLKMAFNLSLNTPANLGNTFVVLHLLLELLPHHQKGFNH